MDTRNFGGRVSTTDSAVDVQSRQWQREEGYAAWSLGSQLLDCTLVRDKAYNQRGCGRVSSSAYILSAGSLSREIDINLPSHHAEYGESVLMKLSWMESNAL